MRKLLAAVLLCSLCSAPALAAGGLDAFLNRVNVQARSDMNGFTTQVAAQFGVPEAQVRIMVGQVASPADAFMVFQLGQMANQRPATVLQVYQKHRGRGWGVIAQELGIKPGSPEFHALKRGDLHFGPGAPQFEEPGPGRGRGRGRP